ncbi:transcription factor DUO1-like [Cornus florida]|uniref:transcription factor DUO1-like n=1 Tax=Cornus florida TaxID=4283 RepID=UPI00289A0B52|nr:transcription factor DUO1-like [Cornus florida]
MEEMIRKGQWTAEEDEVLINFVKKYGPRDWSSIRSKGLLPRTGKSCRLRWVNKLRPNLKIGCKFSAEEERVVIELQARFGNKWATIASNLPGRTDNDVKNFWSTRQKKLARILKSSSSQRSKSRKNKGKAMDVNDMPTLQAPKYSPTLVKEESTSHCYSCSSCSMHNTEMTKMTLPDLMSTNMVNVNTSLPFVDVVETDERSSTKAELSLLPESHDFVEGVVLDEPNYLDMFTCREVSELGNVPHLSFQSPFLELESSFRADGRAEDDKLETPDSFFDDFPGDMFD